MTPTPQDPSKAEGRRPLRPGARIEAAIEVLRAEAMQAVADAAMQIKQTSRLSMRKMIVDERARLRLSLQEVADRAGVCVVEAVCGVEAVAATRRDETSGREGDVVWRSSSTTCCLPGSPCP